MNRVEVRGSGWYRVDGKTVRGLDAVAQQLAGNGNAAANESLAQAQADRLRFVRRAGLQYTGERDVYKVAGYLQDTELKFEHYMSRYQRQAVAGRIVDMPPQTTWRKRPLVKEPDKDETAFTKQWAELVARLKVWRHFERIDRLSRIGQYGVLLIGVAGETELAEPLPTLQGPKSVIYLRPIDERAAQISKWDKDRGSARYGLPLMYRVELSNDPQGFGSDQVNIHHSRLIHVAEDALLDDVYGRPALRRLLNLLMDLEKVTAATAEAYWQLADRILMVSIDPKVQMTDPQRAALGSAIEEMMHDLRRQLTARGVDAKWLESTPPDPEGAADLYMMLLAAAAGIPKRVLFGSETGERASTQDERQWLGTISERQVRHAEPNILRQFLDRLIEHNGLVKPAGGYEVEWPPLFELDEVERAALSAKRAETAKSLTPLGGNPDELVTIDDNGEVHLIPTDQRQNMGDDA